MAETPDIFTAIYGAILEALRGSAAFNALVAVRGVVDATDPDFEVFPPNEGAGDTPEVALVQTDFSQSDYSTGDPVVHRTQAYALVITGRNLNPTETNRVKAACLDALVDRGPRLGLQTRGVTGYSVAGRDAMTAEPAGLPGDGRERFGYQVVATVTVNFSKPLPRRT